MSSSLAAPSGSSSSNSTQKRYASAPFNQAQTSAPRSQILKDRTHGGYGNHGGGYMNGNGYGNNNNGNGMNGNGMNNGMNGGPNGINGLNGNGNVNGNGYNGYNSNNIYNGNTTNAPPHSDAFPERYTHCGILDVRTNKKRSWKRRYFVLSNNFLLCGSTQFAKKLERVTALEGSKIIHTGYLINDENKNDHGHSNSGNSHNNENNSENKDSNNNNNNNNGSNSKNEKAKDLRNRFELMLRSKKILYFRAPNPQQCQLWSNHIERAASLKIKDIYRFLYTLGTSESQMTKVVSAKHKLTGEDCAIKIVDKRTCDQKMLQSEIKILKKLDNEYIVQLYDLFETKKFLYIVMEKCEGGELFDQIADLDGDHYTETDCCRVMYQIAHGVKYMHSQGIVHRDLKPENILCVEPKSIRKVKIADFGISKMVKNPENIDNATFQTMAGTLSYTAPEILRGKGYTKAVDCWSIGVIMYILLCGYAPFWGESDSELSYEILKNEVEFEKEDWEHVGEDSIRLVTGLLDKNPDRRLSLDDILKLTWRETSRHQLKGGRFFRKKFRGFVIRRKKQRMMSAPFANNNNNKDHVVQLTLPLGDRDSLRKQDKK